MRSKNWIRGRLYRLMRIAPGTLAEMRANIILNGLAHLRGTGERRDRDVSENEYSWFAGSTIDYVHTRDIEKFAIIDDEVRKFSMREVIGRCYAERNDILGQLQFRSVLEVGAGELTFMHSVYDKFGPSLDLYGLDITLNRLLHGLRFAQSRQMPVTVVQADGTAIPFPDNSFDLVVSHHALEQMPTIFRDAITEMIRVSRKHVVLFEPFYQRASLLEKLRMRASDYVRGIYPFVRNLPGVRLHPPFVCRNHGTPYNHTGVFILEKTQEGVSNDPRVICPVSRGELQAFPGGHYSVKSSLYYPTVRGVPVLYKKYAQVISADLLTAQPTETREIV
ncbi:MAG TPA: class I SAM-dependent methyltransferase [Pyrinomonadaceae bacterium]|nr:class I SAM-dependent methyltransferase [Pyrinomonadaceae bacterium]